MRLQVTGHTDDTSTYCIQIRISWQILAPAIAHSTQLHNPARAGTRLRTRLAKAGDGLTLTTGSTPTAVVMVMVTGAGKGENGGSTPVVLQLPGAGQ